MADYSGDALRRRLTSKYAGQFDKYMDPRSTSGEYARGSNVYGGGSPNAGGGRPRTMGGGPRPNMSSGSQPDYGLWGQKSGGGSRQQGPAGQGGQQPYTFNFNPVYATRMRQLQAERAQLNSGRELNERRIGEGYAWGMDALRRALERNMDQNEMNMADQGILRSGINIREQGKIGEEHQRGVSDLAANVARQREDMTRQYASGEQSILDQIDLLERQRAADEMRQRREEEFRRAEMEAYQQALENMQPVMDSQGRYHAPGWRPVTNTQYNIGVSHDMLSPIERRLQQ